MKVIQYNEYLMALGLWKLHEQAEEKRRQIEVSLAELLELKDNGAGYYGHLSDSLFNGDTLDSTLKKLGIVRVDPRPTPPPPDEDIKSS